MTCNLRNCDELKTVEEIASCEKKTSEETYINCCDALINIDSLNDCEKCGIYIDEDGVIEDVECDDSETIPDFRVTLGNNCIRQGSNCRRIKFQEDIKIN